MKKIQPQQILAGGIISLSLLLTSVQGFAKDPVPTTSGLSSMTSATSTSSTSSSSGSSTSEPTLSNATTTSTAPAAPKPEYSAAKPDTTSSSSELTSLSNASSTGSTPTMSSASSVSSGSTSSTTTTVSEEPESSYTGSAWDYLNFDCLKIFEAEELAEVCAATDNCVSQLTSTDEAGNTYFLMKTPTINSQCTTANGGYVAWVTDATPSDPKVVCSYIKSICRE